jgi:hypothetical protein
MPYVSIQRDIIQEYHSSSGHLFPQPYIRKMLSHRSSPVRLIQVAIFALFLSSSLYGNAHPHDPPSHQNEDATSIQIEESLDSYDEMEAQRVEEALEREREKERWKNILVYSCFGLSLFILLWMRKKSKDRAAETE